MSRVNKLELIEKLYHSAISLPLDFSKMDAKSIIMTVVANNVDRIEKECYLFPITHDSEYEVEDYDP